MNGDKVARTHQIQNQLQFFFTGMSRNMHGRPHGPVDKISTAPCNMVHHAVNLLFIARNDARTEDDRVALLNIKMLVIVDRDARQGRHRFALSARDNNGHFFRRHLHDVLRTEQRGIWNLQQAKIVRDLCHVQHAAAQKRHLAAIFGGQIKNLLQAVNGAAEQRKNQTPFAAREQFFQPWTHGAFAFGIAGAVHIG